MRARDGAHVEVDASTVVAGTAGDLKCGAKAARTWSNFRSSAPLRNEVDVTGDAAEFARIWE